MTEREWYSLNDAAELLGVSQRTVRRWVHAGTLAAELRPGRNGPQYFIDGADLAAVERRSRRSQSWASADELHELADRLDELQQGPFVTEVRDLRARILALQEEHAELQRQHAELLALVARNATRRRDLRQFRQASMEAIERRAARRLAAELGVPGMDGAGEADDEQRRVEGA
jgi:excisionase family DNA binding protein